MVGVEGLDEGGGVREGGGDDGEDGRDFGAGVGEGVDCDGHFF